MLYPPPSAEKWAPGDGVGPTTEGQPSYKPRQLTSSRRRGLTYKQSQASRILSTILEVDVRLQNGDTVYASPQHDQEVAG